MSADPAWVPETEPDPVVARALAGDRSAELELCRRLLPAVRAFARRRLQPASVDDFAHDALLLFVEALRAGRINEPERLAGFALGICRNLARDRARTDERRRELLERYSFEPDELTPSSEQLASAHLEDCFSQLIERARRVLRMTFCDEAPDSEIAGALSVSEANVRVIRHRSLAQLKLCLDKPISWVQA